MVVDIGEKIKLAKLGRERKAAQEDTCTVFASALGIVLEAVGIPCTLCTATSHGVIKWGHAVVRVGDTYYDSLGAFSPEVYRARAKVHPTVQLDIRIADDPLAGDFTEEFEELYAFYCLRLGEAFGVSIDINCNP